MLSDVTKKYDPEMMKLISSFHNTLNRNSISIKDLNEMAERLVELYKGGHYSYIKSILFPETYHPARIPTIFPVPSSAFQYHLTGNFVTNSSGNVAMVWNPVFFQENQATGAIYSTFFVNLDNALVGNISNNNFNAVEVGYNTLPKSLYGSFKVVSASIVVSYIGRLDSSAGVIGIGIGLNNQSGIGTPALIGAADSGSQIFGNFLLVDNLYYSSRSSAVNGCRGIYFPIDQKYLNFLSIYTGVANTTGGVLANTFLNGFYFVVYAQNVPSQGNVPVLRADMYVNVECVVQPAFANFIPTELPNASNIDVLNEIGNTIKGNPNFVTSSTSDVPGTDRNEIGNLDNIARKFVGDYPSINQIQRMV